MSGGVIVLPAEGRLTVSGHGLEYRLWGDPMPRGPEIVLLHEGLGCVGLWGDFPARLAEATGRCVFAYSRAGYGWSSPVTLPRPLTYMHDEALDVLPAVLDAIGFRQGMLVGHSDGASIAAIHAGRVRDARVQAIVLIAPHFVVEDISITAIAAAKIAYDQGDLRVRLARWHADPDNAFRGWNDAWLDPAFRVWDIAPVLETVTCPVQVVQGEADQYGTLRQVEIARARCRMPVEVHMLPAIGHAPHREATAGTLALVAGFARTALA